MSCYGKEKIFLFISVDPVTAEKQCSWEQQKKQYHDKRIAHVLIRDGSYYINNSARVFQNVYLYQQKEYSDYDGS